MNLRTAEEQLDNARRGKQRKAAIKTDLDTECVVCGAPTRGRGRMICHTCRREHGLDVQSVRT